MIATLSVILLLYFSTYLKHIEIFLKEASFQNIVSTLQ